MIDYGLYSWQKHLYQLFSTFQGPPLSNITFKWPVFQLFPFGISAETLIYEIKQFIRPTTDAPKFGQIFIILFYYYAAFFASFKNKNIFILFI